MRDYNIEKYDFECFEKEHLPFTMIPNQVIQKMPAKKMKAGFLWVFLQSLSPSWEINKSHITKHFEISDTTYERWMGWLNRVNLIEYRQKRNSNGSFGKSKLVVLNGTKFNIYSNSCRSVKIDGVDTDRSAILPFNGEAVATANDGHINTTLPQSQEVDTNVCGAKPSASHTMDNYESNPQPKPQEVESQKPDTETDSKNESMEKMEELKDRSYNNESLKTMFYEKFASYKIDYDELFQDCLEHYQSKGQWVTPKKWKKWIEREEVANYPKKEVNKASGQRTPEHDEYREYVGRIKSDITLKLIDENTPIMSFDQWLKTKKT